MHALVSLLQWKLPIIANYALEILSLYLHFIALDAGEWKTWQFRETCDCELTLKLFVKLSGCGTLCCYKIIQIFKPHLYDEKNQPWAKLKSWKSGDGK